MATFQINEPIPSEGVVPVDNSNVLSMNDHFTKLSNDYNDIRNTDLAPVSFIANKLKNRTTISGADIGCGAGRYDLLLLRQLPTLDLTCCDSNEQMLNKTSSYLRSNDIRNFHILKVDANNLSIPNKMFDFISSFNAVHHFEPITFLRQSASALKSKGYLFVYTRLRSQNERTIWGRFFPQFHEKEDRLYDLGDVEIWAKSLNFLRLVGMEFFQFNRRASLGQLLGKAERKHYSTFSLYTREDFRQAMNGFQARIKNHFSDANNIRWSDENIMLVFQRIE